MRLILSIFLFAALIFGNQKITNPETGEEISLYNKSWAVIIGVNKYEHVKPLDYCVADANSIESLLIENFDFNPDNVIMLTNQEATLQGIRNAFDHIMKEAGKDDRVLIYFAGHGFTEDLPGIDAGNPDSEYNDPDGSRNNMGAYGVPGGNW